MKLFLDISRNLGNIRFKPFTKYCYGNFSFSQQILFSFFRVCRLFGPDVQIIHLISDILDIYIVFVLKVVQQCQFQLSVKFSVHFSCLYVLEARSVNHTISQTWTMSHLRVFSISIYQICKSIHHLPAIFPDLQMTQDR